MRAERDGTDRDGDREEDERGRQQAAPARRATVFGCDARATSAADVIDLMMATSAADMGIRSSSGRSTLV